MNNTEIISDYIALAKAEILKAMRHEISRGGTHKGAEYIHHTMENLMHIKTLGPELMAAAAGKS